MAPGSHVGPPARAGVRLNWSREARLRSRGLLINKITLKAAHVEGELGLQEEWTQTRAQTHSEPHQPLPCPLGSSLSLPHTHTLVLTASHTHTHTHEPPAHLLSHQPGTPAPWAAALTRLYVFPPDLLPSFLPQPVNHKLIYEGNF